MLCLLHPPICVISLEIVKCPYTKMWGVMSIWWVLDSFWIHHLKTLPYLGKNVRAVFLTPYKRLRKGSKHFTPPLVIEGLKITRLKLSEWEHFKRASNKFKCTTNGVATARRTCATNSAGTGTVYFTTAYITSQSPCSRERNCTSSIYIYCVASWPLLNENSIYQIYIRSVFSAIVIQ